MNLLLELFIAAAIIVGFAVIRIIADRRAMQARLRAGHVGAECKQVTCFGGCDPDKASQDPVSKRDTLKRSA